MDTKQQEEQDDQTVQPAFLPLLRELRAIRRLLEQANKKAKPAK